MEGANGIDLSMCRAAWMLNLDNEEEGVLLTSCSRRREGFTAGLKWRQRSCRAIGTR